MSFDGETLKRVAPLMAGTIGGGISTTLLYPLDLVKVRLQVNEGTSGTSMGILSTLRGVVRHEGVLGLYQGVIPAILGNAVSWGGYFYFYEHIKLQLVERRRKRSQLQKNETVILSHVENFLAACLSGSIMVLITNPIWLIKTRMQLQLKRTQQAMMKQNIPHKEGMIHAPYRNMLDAASTILREEGPLALYKGTIPALLLTSHGGIQFVVYEFLKRKFNALQSSESSKTQTQNTFFMDRFQNSLGVLTMGGISKVVASTATFPLQTIKARIQQRTQGVELMNGGEVTIIKRTEYKGVIDCIHGIWKNEGARGFFKGCATNAMRVAPSSAVTFVLYEGLMDFFRQFEK